MKLTPGDWLRISAVATGLGGIFTAQLLVGIGIAPAAAGHIATAVGALVAAVALISNVFANPSAPAGTNFAVIPQGTIPAVGMSLGQGPSVAKIDPSTATVQPLTGAKGN